MTEYLETFYEAATDIAPDEVIGALAIGLALAMACSGLCILGRRRSSDAFPTFCGLIFAVSALSMVVGIGHARYKYLGPGKDVLSSRPFPDGRPPAGWPGPPPGGLPMPPPLGRMLVHEADANRDGRLTPEEAARYVREVDAGGRGWVSSHELDQARTRHGAPPTAGQNPPEPATPGPNPPGPETSDGLE